MGIKAKNFKNLIGNNSKYNAQKILEIFKGEDNDFSTSVCLNAAAGLIVSEKFKEFKEAYNESKKQILVSVEHNSALKPSCVIIWNLYTFFK